MQFMPQFTRMNAGRRRAPQGHCWSGYKTCIKHWQQMAVKHHEAAVLQYKNTRTHTHTHTHSASSLLVDMKQRQTLERTFTSCHILSPTGTAIITRGDMTGDNHTQKHHQCNSLLAHRKCRKKSMCMLIKGC